MKIREIVKVNESGMVANAVDFNMMANPDKNLRLCEGFVFNYDTINPKAFTLGVLDAICKSYHSQNQPNIHLFVQDYGKGKSHFALVTANYFKLLLDTAEVEGILNQIKIASGNNLVEDLKAYKRRNKQHLVICISGDLGTDLRQMFLRSLRQTLEIEGITNYLAQQLCEKPLKYLKQLTENQKKIANDYLELHSHQRDVNSIIELLEEDNYKIIFIVKEISSELNNGFSIDFETDLSIETILQELINKLCSGDAAKYSGILILFDELNYYLKSWATDSSAAGGASLQSITKVCENNKGKIALVCFTQIRPSKSIPSQSADDYNKLVSRLEIAESTYEPVSSLELVIKGLLEQQINTDSWNQFFQTWRDTLLADSRNSHEHRISIYRERQWTLQDFQINITLGCFPLHPLNSYLLCNLDFTQGRTAIQYIKEDVKKFINSQFVEKNSKLNYLHAISLVDAFSEFSHTEFSRHYSEYKKAYDTISASATENEIAVLKGLFLFYVSQNKLYKPESEKHDVIISELTGLSLKETKETLDKLDQQKQVIHHNTGDNTYRFYSGSNLLEVRQEIEEEASKQSDRISVNLAVKHCNEKIETYLNSININGTHFINENQLLNDEWFFEYKFYNIPDFKQQVLNGYKTLDNITGKGIFAYILSDTLEELQSFRYEINELLSTSRNKESIVVAIPEQPVNNICQDLLMIDIMRRKSTIEKQDSGTAFTQLTKQIQQKLEREIKQIIAPNNCNYYCIRLEELTTHQQKNHQSIVSHLLQQLYRFVPPIAKNDKMALKSPSGSTIIGYTANRLLEDDLNSNKFPNQSYNTLVDQVFLNNWGLFKTTLQKYSVQIPTNKNVREAWDKIDQLTALGDKAKKYVLISKIWQELSAPPFGYNEYTFTMLFSAWIVYHRSEVILKGTFGLIKKKNPSYIEEKAIKDWVETNVFDKPKDFVNKWILGSNTNPQLIRLRAIACPKIEPILSYNQAKELISDIDNFINSGDPDQSKVQEIQPKRKQILSEIEKINNWFKAVEETENLFNNGDEIELKSLTEIYPRLQQKLSKIINLTQSNQSDNIVVNPAQKQRQRQNDALQIVLDKIEEIIIDLSEKSESLQTEEEYGRYQSDIEAAIKQITDIFSPTHNLIHTLNYSLDVATRKFAEIKHQAEIKNSLEKVELFYKSLSSNASQDDYIKAISEIKNLANNLEIVKQHKLYQGIIKDIETQLNNLDINLKIWAERLTDITKTEALQLSQEVSQQQNRFTQPKSAQKVKQILEQLNPIILEIQNQEEFDSRKQQQDNKIMDALRQKNPKFLNTIILCEQGIEEIATLHLQLNFSERFYTEIEQLTNSINNKVSSYIKELEELTENLAEVRTNQELNQLYTKLAKLELFFQDSKHYLTCQQLQQEIDALRQLFQITQSSQYNTIETYQNQIQQLTEWYKIIKNDTPNLQVKYDQSKSKLERKIKAIETQYQIDTKLWLDKLQKEFNQIDQETEDKKLNLIDELLKNINNTQNINIDYLSNSDKELLETIKNQCQNIQNDSQENQIISLFTQLSPERQQDLYLKLKEYLSIQEDINE
ncbi:hypothetical protein [Anabaena sp. UHCC 0204]|uniref:hypothetical protein n=1 Tax=Anabaena sp. UHCC 0204 TaxID=2590009 RepID=UPI0014456624|nr:hypothetical protein [Anabaena sp. UHCC 0204]MTJ07069.1 hypothetical protein [Anabaena sp. UHCC 0204]